MMNYNNTTKNAKELVNRAYIALCAKQEYVATCNDRLELAKKTIAIDFADMTKIVTENLSEYQGRTYSEIKSEYDAKRVQVDNINKEIKKWSDKLSKAMDKCDDKLAEDFYTFDGIKATLDGFGVTYDDTDIYQLQINMGLARLATPRHLSTRAMSVQTKSVTLLSRTLSTNLLRIC